MNTVSIAQAEQYFNGRLHAETWTSAAGEDKQKALTHAERDVRTLSFVNPPTDILTAAICEQALFLLSLSTADKERYRAQTLGVSFRWVGDAREDYKGLASFISPHAEIILARYLRKHRRIGGIR